MIYSQNKIFCTFFVRGEKRISYENCLNSKNENFGLILAPSNFELSKKTTWF